MSAVARDGAAFTPVIVRESGRSSIPETSVVETIGRSVLDAPHVQGMTAACEARSDWGRRTLQSKTRAYRAAKPCQRGNALDQVTLLDQDRGTRREPYDFPRVMLA